MDVFVSIIPWHHISFVWVIVAGAQNNDVCRAFFARWMPWHVSVCWNHTARFIVIFSSISTYLKSWQVVSHQIKLPGVQWLKHLFIYLFMLHSAHHTECFVHTFHSRKTFLLYSALHPTTGDSGGGAQRNSYCSWLASPCRCNWSRRCCGFASTLLRCRVCMIGGSGLKLQLPI